MTNSNPEPDQESQCGRHHPRISRLELYFIVWCAIWLIVAELLDEKRPGLRLVCQFIAVVAGLMVLAVHALFNLQIWSEHASFHWWNLNKGPPCTHRWTIILWACAVLMVGGIVLFVLTFKLIAA